ncbi:protein of unknown function [Tenacibaculum sp. 190130A14a]|uniref:TIR domain-containing protein n=1 Tax=Tenacibaculum polynesiense TaxID=3137857 RepID=A0ABM9P856_9FLAO
MKIFISWSGELSKKIAEELQEWIPQVINNVEPYVTSKSIKKGDRWLSEIYKELEESNFGLVCLTKDNLKSPWIMFEAGAISKNLQDSRVSCLLFDGLNQHEVEKPLSFFQNTQFSKEEYQKLMFSINDSLGEKGLTEKVLNKSFEKWWPDLESKVTTITAEYFPKVPKSNKDDILSEIHKTTTYISNAVSRLNLNLPKESLDFSNFTEDAALEFSGHEWNHPVRVLINPVPDKDGNLKLVTITHEGAFIEDSPGPSLRGVLIELLFQSEEGPFWSLTLHFHKGQTYLKVDFAELDKETADKLRGETIWRD